jgi:hypothetical protein
MDLDHANRGKTFIVRKTGTVKLAERRNRACQIDACPKQKRRAKMSTQLTNVAKVTKSSRGKVANK